MSISSLRAAILAATLSFVPCAARTAAANTPPATPAITEPDRDGRILNPADVHMQTSRFADPDAGDTHRCTDWEIWSVTPAERVWAALCIGGVERVHLHLGDGVFQGSHAGRRDLFFDTDYRLRARHRDGSGDPASEWSGWGERPFWTGSPTAIFPMRLQDVVDLPAPQWSDALGAPLVLPGAAPPPSVRLDSPAGELLLGFSGFDGATNTISNPGPVSGDVTPRLVIDAGATASLALPESRLAFSDAAGFDHVVYLPGIVLAAGTQAAFWVAGDGSTFVAQPTDVEPTFSTLARGAPVPWIARQSGYAVEVVATGFQLPVNIAFVPAPGAEPDAPFYYVTELYGTIKVVRRDGLVTDYASGLLNFDPLGNFPGSGEQGLTGIAVEPATGDVFASMLYDAGGGAHYPKVVRFRSVDGGRTAATAATILDMVGETQGQSHQISNLSFGPDGLLYVHMGDGFDADRAQDLDSFRGKVLRLRPDGSAPSDNPFHAPGDGITARDYVYAYGFRNPFGGDWRAADGAHYEVENGPSVDRLARVVPGRNYGYDGSDGSMGTFALYNWNPATAPVNLAFVQPATFGGSGFPADKMDHLFVTESGPTYAAGPQGKRVSEFVLDQAGRLVSGPTTLAEYGGSGRATAVGLAAGPDGLYFTDLYKDQDAVTPIDRGANVLRIRYLGAADFTADVGLGPAPLTVRFFDTSTVPSPTGWAWDFGDGATSTEQSPTHVYAADGVYDVSLGVAGASGVRTVRKRGFVCVGAVCARGLRGEYFDDRDLAVPRLSRSDPGVDFDWGGGSPDPVIDADTFSVRWSGRVRPQFSEDYTFTTRTDDGVRLWVDGRPLIDRWVDQGATEWSGTIALEAGRSYDLRMEYYENGGDAVAQLSWQSPSLPKEIIPADRLEALPPALPPVPCGAVPQTGCRLPAERGKSTLLVKADPALTRRRLQWKWQPGDLASAELGDPLGGTGYRLCVYDGGGGIVASAGVPGGGVCGERSPEPCWRASRGGFTFKDKSGAADGVARMQLRAGSDGTARIRLDARGPGFSVPSLSLASPVRVQLLGPDGVCWEGRYTTLVVRGSTLRARGD